MKIEHRLVLYLVRMALLGMLIECYCLSTSIFGPSLFGLMYMKTVATFPAAIFFLSAVVITIAFVALLLVRLPGLSQPSPESVDVEDSANAIPTVSHETLVGVPDGAQSELRGRKNVSSPSDL